MRPSRISKMWDEAHFDLCARQQGQVAVAGEAEAHHAIVHHPVLGGEALQRLELHVFHLGEHLGVVVGDSAFALKAEAAGRRFPHHVVGVEVKGGLDFVGGFGMEVGLRRRPGWRR